jgi:hypothetical protein
LLPTGTGVLRFLARCPLPYYRTNSVTLPIHSSREQSFHLDYRAPFIFKQKRLHSLLCVHQASAMSSELQVHDWIARRLSQGLDFRLDTRQPPQPDSIIFKNAPLIDHWVKDQGPQCLFAGLARMRRPVGGHSFHVVLGFSPPSDCEGKIVYFLRTVNTELSMQIICSDSSVLCGELPHTLSNSLEFAQEQLQNVMLPLVQVG